MMNMKKIIREETEEFNWIKDVPEGTPMEEGVNYMIDFDGSDLMPDDLKDKFLELFGDDVFKERNRYVNWFDNNNMYELFAGEKIVLYLNTSNTNNDYGVHGSWNTWTEDGNPSKESVGLVNGVYGDTYKIITPEEFLNLVRM